MSDAHHAEYTFSAALKFDRDVDMKRVKVITIALAVMFVLVAVSAQPVAAASRSDSLRSYISGRYDAVRGGYSPPSDSVVRVDATYGAVLAQYELGSLSTRPPPVNLTKVLDSIVLRQWLTNQLDSDLDQKRYGGFSEYLVGPVTMSMTLKGVQAIEMLKEQSDYPGIASVEFDEDALLSYINRSLSEAGGFSSIPGNSPDIVSTYQALYILDYLDTTFGLNIDEFWNETATLEWINNCRVGDAFKLSPISDTAGVTATSAGIMALSLLPSNPTISNLQAAINWVLDRQILEGPDDRFIGGFEEGVQTDDVNFKTTYNALKFLEFENALGTVNETLVVDFILNCQVEDGSWGFVPDATVGTLVYSGQACELLNMFGNAASILGSSEDPYSPGGFTLDWRYLLIGGIVIVALVIAILSVRRD